MSIRKFDTMCFSLSACDDVPTSSACAIHDFHGFLEQNGFRSLTPECESLANETSGNLSLGKFILQEWYKIAMCTCGLVISHFLVNIITGEKNNFM